MTAARKCPHPDITRCPLYHAAHVAGAPSCFSQRMDAGLCAVDLGQPYEALLSALNAKFPLVAAECHWQSARQTETLH